ncbi:MAG: sigma-54-dependent Fis family transcriptional regulator [Candidatus Aminicenantes bacterium]|nr:MAG: sigma-54-dependent Fis family transcriptional regulator [Candidatus Aminicenantes bacterium]
MKERRVSPLGKILDVIMQEIPSQLGAILRVDGKNRIVEKEVQPVLVATEKKLRADIIRNVLENEHPLILSDQSLGVSVNILCLPLVENGKSIGGIYLSRGDVEGVYSNRDIEVLAAFAQPVNHILRRGSNIKESPPAIGPNSSCLVGKSQDFFRVLHFIECVKNNNVPVFISGESGTGKEVVARTIHNSGSRKERKFIAVNCGAIPDHLLESELFGYARGAFTGAVKEKPGLIEEANHGTFFFDEIGDLSPHLQAKLLRVIQEKEIRRIGENRMRLVDARFISATNKDIEEEVCKGRFREDLYYRLNIVSVSLSPLRKRREDILSLVNYLIEKYCCELKRERVYFSPGALQLILSYSWPGNVRELQNEIQRCLILCGEDNLIREEYLSKKIRQKNKETFVHLYDYFHAKAEFEKRFLNEALARSDYNRTRTAEEIGLSRQGLFKLMKKHGLQVNRKNECV